MNNIKLIAFDLDGVLIDGKGSWNAVHKALGTLEKSNNHAEAFYSKKITFDQWAEKDAKLWEGEDFERVKAALDSLDPMPGAEETIAALKKHYRVVIISGGLQTLADRVKDKFEMDYAIANRIKVKDGRVCGVDQIVDFKGKGRILHEIADMYKLRTDQCAAIGDYSNDIPMFEEAGLSIAFNPKNKETEDSADRVVRKKDLKEILTYLS